MSLNVYDCVLIINSKYCGQSGKIIKLMGLKGDPDQYLDTTEKRPGQDVRYAIDDTKLKALGWSTKSDFDTELEKIVYYYKNYAYHQLNPKKRQNYLI